MPLAYLSLVLVLEQVLLFGVTEDSSLESYYLIISFCNTSKLGLSTFAFIKVKQKIHASSCIPPKVHEYFKLKQNCS